MLPQDSLERSAECSLTQDPENRKKLEDLLRNSAGAQGAKFTNVEDMLKNIRTAQGAEGTAGGEASRKPARSGRDPDDDILGDDLLGDHDEL